MHAAEGTRPDSGLREDWSGPFGGLRGAQGVVLAVSGGPDSTALMHLASAWRAQSAVPMWVATVDHALRPGSAAEAQRVLQAALALGLPCEVLAWQGDKPVRASQERARTARYRLLNGFAGKVGASHLVTAHTLDDQAETLLYRLAAGSGLKGLGGMRSVSQAGSLLLVRPFLDVRKRALISLCEENGWPYAQDPSNAEARFARTRWRRLAPSLASEGITPERLGILSKRLARANDALHRVAAEIAARCAEEAATGRRSFRGADLFAYPDELVLRVLEEALAAVSDAGPIRLNRLENLLVALRENSASGRAMRRTLSRCIVELDRHRVVTVRREGQRRRGTTASL